MYQYAHPNCVLGRCCALEGRANNDLCYQGLCSSKKKKQEMPNVVAQSHSPSSWEAEDDCWVHKLQASLVSTASCQLHSRGGGREESEHGDDEICHSFSCLLLMCRELVSLLSVIDFKSILKLVYKLAPENFLKENHILASMFSSGPRNKLFKRVDT